MEYTQEQLNALIAEEVSKATAGLYTQAQLQAEVDRRVESGIQKGIETQKKKWEEEFSKKASLTAEELAKQQLEEKMKEISSKERELSKRNNIIEAKDMFTSANVPKSHYEKMLDLLVTDDGELTKANVNNFIDIFNSTKKDIETQIKSEFSKVPPPSGDDKNKTITKEDFKKMGYAEKLKFKTDFPEQYNEFIK